MDKKFFDSLAAQHAIESDVVKQIFLEICKEMAGRLIANEKQSCPYFVIKPVSKPAREKTQADGSQKSLKAIRFGKMTLKGIMAGEVA